MRRGWRRESVIHYYPGRGRSGVSSLVSSNAIVVPASLASAVTPDVAVVDSPPRNETMSMSVPSTCLAARSLPVAAARHLSACRSRAARGHVAPAQIARTIAAPSSPSPSSSSSRRRRHHVLTTAGWNDFEWGTASIVSNDAATPKGGLRSIVISVDASVAEGYVTPGQFVQMRTSEDGKPAFLAIASAPADVSSSSSAKTNELSLLVKSSDGTAGEICALEAGAEVGVSPAMGSGFDVSKVGSGRAARCRPHVLTRGIAIHQSRARTTDARLPSTNRRRPRTPTRRRCSSRRAAASPRSAL